MSAPVLIIGAGPTGLAAAILLAKRGVRSVVVERHREVYPLPRAVHLDDEIMRILQQLGISEEFSKLSRPAAGLRLVDDRLGTIVEFRRERMVGVYGWPQANMFDQPDLERLLRAMLAKYPEIQLRQGVEVVRLATEPGAVVAGLRDVDTGQADSLCVRAVLGCDGANSMTREFIGAKMRDLRFEERWLVVDIRCAAQLPVWNGVYQVCDPRRAATFMQVGTDRYRWEFRLGDGETPEDIDLATLLAPWTAEVTENELRLLRKAEYTFRARVADRWRRGRTFLLGDAAHLTPPFIGQGMGSGLRDAVNLVWKLALVLSEGADEGLLDTYESERKPHATRVIRNAVLVGWAMTGAPMRRRLVTAVCRVPMLTDLALRSASPRLKRGPLVRRRPVDRLAGSLCPQPWVTTSFGRQRLDDVIGDSFAVLHSGVLATDLAVVACNLDARVISVDGCQELTDWLRRARVPAVVIRPDRVVLASWRGARDASAWLSLLPSVPAHRLTEENQ